MINLSVSLFGQITRYRIYTVSRGPIRLLEIQYPTSNIIYIYIYIYIYILCVGINMTCSP